MVDVPRSPLIYKWPTGFGNDRDRYNYSAINSQEFINPLPIDLVLPPASPAVVEWFNPPGPRSLNQDWIQPSDLSLLTAVVVVAVDDPAVVEWFNPPGPHPLNQDWIQPSNLPLLTAVVDVPVPLPLPNSMRVVDLPPRPAQRGVQDHIDALFLPAVGPNLPPSGEQSFDLPPRAPLRGVQDLTLLETLYLPAVGPNLPPSGEQSFDLPPRTAQRGVQGLTLIDTLFIQAIGPNLPPSGEQSVDLPPRAPQRSNSLLTHINQLYLPTVGPNLPPPGMQSFDLPPRAPQRSVSLLTHTNPLYLPAVGPNLPPAPQTNWPVPSSQRRNLADWQDYILPWATAPPSQQLPLTTFANYDWPNSLRGQPPRQDYILSAQINLALGLKTPPKTCFDWPNPRAAQRGPQDWIQPTNLSLLTTVVVVNPNITIKQSFDLPPRAAQRRPQDWILQINLGLSLEVPPETCFEWSCPHFSFPGILRRPQDWILPLNLPGATFVLSPPIAQHDWPNPKGPIFPVSLLTFLGYPSIQVLLPPIFGTDLAAEMLKNEIERTLELRDESGRIILLKNEKRRGA